MTAAAEVLVRVDGHCIFSAAFPASLLPIVHMRIEDPSSQGDAMELAPVAQDLVTKDAHLHQVEQLLQANAKLQEMNRELLEDDRRIARMVDELREEVDRLRALQRRGAKRSGATVLMPKVPEVPPDVDTSAATTLAQAIALECGQRTADVYTWIFSFAFETAAGVYMFSHADMQKQWPQMRGSDASAAVRRLAVAHRITIEWSEKNDKTTFYRVKRRRTAW